MDEKDILTEEIKETVKKFIQEKGVKVSKTPIEKRWNLNSENKPVEM